uniref:Uncharacterized protein n=1 Tax=Rhizophora mucronata TaxID=61149 RepID=A0A2P2QU01_RHIMU
MVGLSGFWCKSISNFLSHTARFTTVAAATCFASAVNCATILCFVELQQKAPNPKENTQPEVLYKSLAELPQSLSVNLFKFSSSLFNRIPSLTISFMYPNTLFASLNCILLGSCINLENRLVECTICTMSGLNDVRYKS